MGSGNLRLFRNNTARNPYSSVFLQKEGKIKYECVVQNLNLKKLFQGDVVDFRGQEGKVQRSAPIN